MSTFRCRHCDILTDDPLGHAEDAHDLPQTMTQVWEAFTLIASHYGATGERAKPFQLDEPLW